MKHMDEKVISMLIEAEAKRNPAASSSAGTGQTDRADLSKLLVEIEGEKVMFHEQELLDGRVRITMPRSLRPMTRQEALVKYPSERRPAIIFTNDDLSINLTFNHTANVLDEADVEEFKDAMVQITRSTQPIREWIGDGVQQAEEKTFGYCEFMSPALNTNIYNLMIFASLDKRFLICTFNCIEEDKKAWRPVALAMLDSLRVHETAEGGGAQ
ncbi:hypothetical protein MKX64_16775 [Paenibacillus sp. FSL M8-0334]|uniref:Uncharacterized protein n=1 Tax=Paenibacillus campinasensis TaxID=66347 RepID=A0ABW9T7Z9_9BACL|nr:hypothetical protein [Paenibacillus campinasensis]MUG68863.1 hypothetical protein [Paenibacillus campinasensis]